jgi:hypothetical protein
VVNDSLDERSHAPDFEHWESPETRVRWERGLAIVAGMIGVVLVFFMLLAALPISSGKDDDEPVRGSQGALAQGQASADAVVPTAEATPQATATPAPSSAQKLPATSRAVPNVRRQPSLSGPVVMNLRQGQQVEVVGRTPDNQWLQILNPERPAEKLWVSADMLEVTGDWQRSLPEVRE